MILLKQAEYFMKKKTQVETMIDKKILQKKTKLKIGYSNLFIPYQLHYCISTRNSFFPNVTHNIKFIGPAFTDKLYTI